MSPEFLTAADTDTQAHGQGYATELIADMCGLYEQALAHSGILVVPCQGGDVWWRDWLSEDEKFAARALDPVIHPDTQPADILSLLAMKNGKCIGVIGLRYFKVDSVLDLVGNGGMWWPEVESSDSRFSLDDGGLKDFGGRVFYQGGLYIDPRHHGQGLDWYLSRMIRWLGFWHSKCSHALGGFTATFPNDRDPHDYNGHPLTVTISSALGDGAGPLTMQLCTLSRNEALAAAGNEKAEIKGRQWIRNAA